jgi:putative nucleotidyltransferase with HDIG domain
MDRLGSTAHRWKARPVAATLVRLTTVVVPFLAGLAAARLAVNAFDARSWPARITVWVLATVLATAVVTIASRAARRLMPLSTLLAVSLAFPDRTPSRLGIALRAGATKRLLEHDADRRHRPELDAARVLALAAGLAAHDRATRGHSERVRAYSELIADELRLDDTAHDRLRWAALLHDIGKVTVPRATLNATHPLTADEWAMLRRHPEAGHELTAPLASWLGEWEAAVAQHHERYDGGGYPSGLAGDEIALAARIVCVADSFDAMTSERTYARPMSLAEARQTLVDKAGGQFDPDVVRAFLNVGIGRLRRILGFAALAAAVPALFPIVRIARRAPATAAAAPMALIAAVSLGVISPVPARHAPVALRPAAPATASANGTQPAPATTDAATASSVVTRDRSRRTKQPSAPSSSVGTTPDRDRPGRNPSLGPVAPAPALPCQIEVGVACAGIATALSSGIFPADVLLHGEVRPTDTAVTVDRQIG